MGPRGIVAVALLLLAGCDNHVSLDLASSGALDAQHVRLAVSGVKLLDDAGNTIALASGDTRVRDLPNFDNGSTIPLLAAADLPPGRYVGLGLLFAADGAQIVTSDGQAFPITVPASAQFFDVDFSAGRGDSVALWASLDLRLSLSDRTSTTANWALAPRLVVVDLGNAASVAGTISQPVRDSAGCLQGRAAPPPGSAVYAYPLPHVVPYDDSPAASPHPAGTVAVTWNGNGSGSYRFAHLQPGRYTLALNCKASEDDPSAAQGQVFAASGDVTLSAGEAATLDFD